jgi:hypothetical protein
MILLMLTRLDSKEEPDRAPGRRVMISKTG